MKERVPPRQMGSIAMSKGPYLEPISSVVCDTSKSSAVRRISKEVD